MPTEPTHRGREINAARLAVSYGLMTSLQIEREASLRLHYRGRKDSHRSSLRGRMISVLGNLALRSSMLVELRLRAGLCRDAYDGLPPNGYIWIF